MEPYVLIKLVHVISSTLLFGTGVGSAFYLFFITWSRDVAAIAAVSRWVVRADWLFTATTIVVQPLTGLWMLAQANVPVSTFWVWWSLVLFGLAAACWLPVVWLQIRLRDLAAAAAARGGALPDAYWRAFGAWVALGIPALLCFLVIFYLMVARPT